MPENQDYMLTSLENGVRIIKFNRPRKKNAIFAEMYVEITSILNEDANNDAVVVTIFTGTGDYYTSGNDLNKAFEMYNLKEDFDKQADEAVNTVDQFFTALIDYPKLLIGVVNGPAVGVGVTSLALFDIVYASDTATFVTPFVNLGLRPEGCSTFLFPLIMGRSKATEMLMLGRKITAQEAYMCGLVSEVIPNKDLDKFMEKLKTFGKKMSVEFIKSTKELVTVHLRDRLHDSNKQELNAIRKCMYSPEYFDVLMQFSTRKSKL